MFIVGIVSYLSAGMKLPGGRPGLFEPSPTAPCERLGIVYPHKVYEWKWTGARDHLFNQGFFREDA